MSDPYAPIVLFCYNRPAHVRQTVAALQRNTLAGRSRLIVFSDGPKKMSAAGEVKAVREYIKGIHGFKSVTVYESPVNKGLAASVIAGVTQIIALHGKVIVVEDDIVTTPDFLTFMNELLEVYATRTDIFSVTGYAPQVSLPSSYKKDLYLAPRASSWGWGTWADRWERVDWSSNAYRRLLADPALKKAFVKGGEDLWPMLVKQQRGVIDSWAIRWALAHSLHNAYGVYPVRSKIRNIGTDGTGTNFTFSTREYEGALHTGAVAADPALAPEETVISAFARFYQMRWLVKLKNYINYQISPW